MNDMDPVTERYSRQILFAPIGRDGQERLRRSTVGLIGLGALGCTIAEMLVRAGIGRLIAVDRDVIEPSNLHRQALYLDADSAERLPKAVAAARRLSAINPDVKIEAHVEDFSADNAVERFAECDVIVDGTDSFETRYLLNDLAVSLGKPWVYGACVAASGLTATIIPGKTPCLACLFPDPPEVGTQETCDTRGIIAPAAAIVASIEVTEVLKILTGKIEAVRSSLLSIELWPFRIVELGKSARGPRPDCRACGRREFPYLDGVGATRTVKMCGRNSVQIHPGPGRKLDLDRIADAWLDSGEVTRNGFSVMLSLPEYDLTLFPDGRCLVRGTTDPAVARSLYARFVGT